MMIISNDFAGFPKAMRSAATMPATVLYNIPLFL